MANTYGKTSMEEFAAKALPELEDLLERFKDQNKPDATEPEPVKHDDADDGDERVKELAHIIWHIANQIESIAYHNEDISEKVISSMQGVKREMKYVNCYLRGNDDEPRF